MLGQASQSISSPGKQMQRTCIWVYSRIYWYKQCISQSPSRSKNVIIFTANSMQPIASYIGFHWLSREASLCCQARVAIRLGLNEPSDVSIFNSLPINLLSLLWCVIYYIILVNNFLPMWHNKSWNWNPVQLRQCARPHLSYVLILWAIPQWN